MWYLRWKNNFFKTCRDICEPSPLGRKGVKHKSSQLSGQQLYCRDATLDNKENIVSYSHSCLEEAKQKRESPRFTLGIFLLLLPFWGSPKEKKVSSGLLGVEGGLILDGDPVPSRLSFRISGSLKLRRSEFCRKKIGLESNWKGRRSNQWTQHLMYLCFIAKTVMVVNPVGHPQHSASKTAQILTMLTYFCTHKELAHLLG